MQGEGQSPKYYDQDLIKLAAESKAAQCEEEITSLEERKADVKALMGEIHAANLTRSNVEWLTKRLFDGLTSDICRYAGIKKAYEEMQETGVYVPQTSLGDKLTLEPEYSLLEVAARLEREKITGRDIL